ncbi:MAG: GNAT family N-acetyltransferase [Clostridia bacterium]|jgi:acetyltransferase, GNAT family
MIRKFEKKDINDVMIIWKNENIKAHQFIEREYWENNYNYVKEILPNAEIYVYVIENHIVGFIGLNQNYIEGIFIDAHSQSKGIGTLLLNKVKEDRNTLTLSVYKKNVNAIKFYKKNNFIITSESIDKDTNEIEYIMTWVK